MSDFSNHVSEFNALIDAGEWTAAYKLCQAQGLNFATLLDRKWKDFREILENQVER